MRKLLNCVLFLATGLALTNGQTGQTTGFVAQGKVIEGLSFKSTVLRKDVAYAVYLPPDYVSSNRYYPVVYLLHGYSDNESAWIQFGEVQLSADRAIASREIPPMIIVMPDAGVSWYVNDVEGKNPYEDMAIREFIPYIDKTYRTRASRQYRAVGGLSMGGYGALVWALHHPELFSSCLAYSAAIHTEEEFAGLPEQRYQTWFAGIYGTGPNGNRITEHWKKNSVLEMMSALPGEQVEQVKFYIDCGDDDFLYKGNSTLHIVMRDRNISHEYRVKDGGHGWSYWRLNITEGLKFAGKIFQK
jgi:enterochelin esterase-like enzyme